MTQEDVQEFFRNPNNIFVTELLDWDLQEGPYMIDFKEGNVVHEKAHYILTLVTYKRLWQGPGLEVKIIYLAGEECVEFSGWLGKMVVDGVGLCVFKIYSRQEPRHHSRDFGIRLQKEVQARGTRQNLDFYRNN